MSQADRDALAEWFRLEAVGIAEIGSPFYAALERQMADDIQTGGPTWDILEAHSESPADNALALRLLGGVHLLVLTGGAPDLARHYQSTGGDGDASAAWWLLHDLLARRPPDVLDALTRPPQTNEVGRSASLVPGYSCAEKTGLPLRLLELGASAGLNLRADRYWYGQGGSGWGDPDSSVRFEDLWPKATPPLAVPAVIASRAGCDRDPIDATQPEAAMKLLSYVWPDQRQRLQMSRAALEIARQAPVDLAAAPIEDWLPPQLADSAPGVATVVYHSVVWQYLPDPTRELVLATLDEAGARDAEAPLFHLRLEPSAKTYFPAELRLTAWPRVNPAEKDRLLATSGFHFGPVTWVA